MTYFTKVSYQDSGSLDAFSRLRISNPDTLFAVQSQYSADPMQMELGNTGTGTLPTHSTSTRMVQLQATAGSGTSFIQSYQYSPYCPGKSQLIAVTGVLGAGVASTTVDTGYFDSGNGVILRQNGTSGLQLILRTSTGGSVSDTNIVNQANWNIDGLNIGLNSKNPSSLTFDETKAFILLIDLQFLGMGRVRVGFDINGVFYYVHEFLNANSLAVPYMQTATLPVQMLVTATSSATTKTAYFKCATVSSEGGAIEDYGSRFACPEITATAGSSARVPLLSIRPKTTFNTIANRAMFLLKNINIIVTGAADVQWELVVGGTYGGQAWTDVNTTYSAFEYSSTPGTFTNLTGGIVVESGYCSRTSGGVGAVTAPQRFEFDRNLSLRYPITLDRAGAVRSLGTLTLLVSGIGATSACRGSVNFIEIR